MIANKNTLEHRQTGEDPEYNQTNCPTPIIEGSRIIFQEVLLPHQEKRQHKKTVASYLNTHKTNNMIRKKKKKKKLPTLVPEPGEFVQPVRFGSEPFQHY